MTNFGVSRSVIVKSSLEGLSEVGIALCLGNIYYSWQAIRLTNRHGRQYTIWSQHTGCLCICL
jgi:AGZA family xanthine/uracil permease-like MFS transporter